eukprot:1140758-Pelagomonas_calceolata.AAC.3
MASSVLITCLPPQILVEKPGLKHAHAMCHTVKEKPGVKCAYSMLALADLEGEVSFSVLMPCVLL